MRTSASKKFSASAASGTRRGVRASRSPSITTSTWRASPSIWRRRSSSWSSAVSPGGVVVRIWLSASWNANASRPSSPKLSWSVSNSCSAGAAARGNSVLPATSSRSTRSCSAVSCASPSTMACRSPVMEASSNDAPIRRSVSARMGALRPSRSTFLAMSRNSRSPPRAPAAPSASARLSAAVVAPSRPEIVASRPGNDSSRFSMPNPTNENARAAASARVSAPPTPSNDCCIRSNARVFAARSAA